MDTASFIKLYEAGKKKLGSHRLKEHGRLFHAVDFLLNGAYHFDMGTNYQEVQDVYTQKEIPDIAMHLPFPTILLTLQVGDTVAASIFTEDKGPDGMPMWENNKASGKDFGDIICVPFIHFPSTYVLPAGHLCGVPDLRGEDLRHPDRLDQVSYDANVEWMKFMTDWQGEKVYHEAIGSISTSVWIMLRYFLKLLGCRNVEIRDANTKKRSRLLKKKGEPEPKSKDIIIKIPGKGIQYEGETIKEVSFKDVAKKGICGQRRGHFQTYTAERPLFGKHIGTWWWSPIFGSSKRNYQVEVENPSLG